MRLDDLPALSRSTVDRQEPLRDDVARQRLLWPSARVVLVDGHGRFPVAGTELDPVDAADLGPSTVDGAVLLGEHDGVAYWGVPAAAALPLLNGSSASSAAATSPGAVAAASGVPVDAATFSGAATASGVPVDAATLSGAAATVSGVPVDAATASGASVDAALSDAAPARPPDRDWSDLRRSGAELDATAAGLAVTAVAVLGWHRRSPYCPRCGTLSEIARAGWARRCPGCTLEEYPRTDPAVICLVHDGADHVLVARGPDWPEGRFSVLAGFVEAGESLEACVAREVEEEVGAVVTDIRYLGSQPWPFPRSLMIGFEAVADRSAPVRPAPGEIAEVRWVSRADVRTALDAGSWTARDSAPGTAATTGTTDTLVLPGPVSIAGAMLRSWA